MAILPIYTYDARVLREKTREVNKPDAEITKLVLDMFETMKPAKGIGLAANQVGAGHSIFIVDVSEVEEYENTSPLVFINPVITELWGEDVGYEEGCLSVPNLREEIFRPELLNIRYRDLNFEEQELEADGLLARVIQHEYDHLQGIFFTDHLRGLKKKLILPALKKIKRGQADADYLLASVREMDLVDS
jgi:peptide deformylase